MKKILCLLLGVLLLALTFSATAESALTIQPEPDTENFTFDPLNPLDCRVSGLYSDAIAMEDGTVRTVLHYYPEDLPYRRPVVLIGMPSGEDSLSYLVDTGWKDLADSWGFMLVLMTPGDAGWLADETEYTAKVYDFVQGRKYYTNDDSAYYLVGYGDAADAVLAEAIMQPGNYAGAAALGVSGNVAHAMAAAQEADIAIPDPAPDRPADPSVGGKVSEIALPVWIGAAEKTDAVQAVVDYWKKANHTSDLFVSNDYANEIYAPAPYLINSQELSEQSLSKVVVTLGDADYLSKDFLGYLWNAFLCRVRRQDAGNVGALRYFATPDELGMDHVELVVDGMLREFYVYVPEEVKAGELDNVPVVYCFHGSGGCGFEFTSRSGWYKVAEDSNFILVTPTGSTNPKFKSSAAWQDGNDLLFFEQMYDYMLANYSVDKSRVYVTGQSAGTAHTFRLAGYYPDKITALASCSLFGVYEEVDDRILYVCESPVEEYDIPVMVSAGVYDRHFSSTGGCNAAKEVFGKYWLNRYGMDVSWDAMKVYENGNFTNYIGQTDDGVPMFRFQWVSWKAHATVPDELPSLYDFMSRYSRGEDGTLYYMGQPVQIKK